MGNLVVHFEIAARMRNRCASSTVFLRSYANIARGNGRALRYCSIIIPLALPTSHDKMGILVKLFALPVHNTLNLMQPRKQQ